ncbi:helix-turn-helix domain-containing protein [bacterium]|nr:helix-turn-helix domain-containing protein [bacterium]
MELAKKHEGHGFSQFELTQSLLQNLNKLKLTATENIILLELSLFYNPKHADIFPKQKTIALKANCSERSVIRAVQSFIKAGLIMVECKYTNRYKFTQKLLNLCGLVKDFKQGALCEYPTCNEIKKFRQVDDNLSYSGCQNVIKEGDNLSHHEQSIEQKKNNKIVVLKNSEKSETISDEEVLRMYAEKHAKSNIQGYINSLKIKGVAADIIRQYREKERVSKYWDKQAAKTSELIKEYANLKGDPMPDSFRLLKQKLMGVVKNA